MRAFSKALKILASHDVLLAGLMSSALSRADRAEIGRVAFGDGGMVGGSRTGGGSTSIVSPMVGTSGSRCDGEEAGIGDGESGIM